MKRKVVKQGSSTLMVSLPSEWATRFKVKKGDELEVEEKGKALILSMNKERFDKQTEINIDNLYPVAMLSASSIYRAGYDNVKVTYSDPKKIMDMHEMLKSELSGLEIIEQGKTFCVVKKIEESLDEGFEPVLRRIFFLTLNMAEDSLEIINNADYEDLARLKLLEQSHIRLTTYCKRLISKRGYKDHEKSHFIYLIIDLLEKTARSYRFLFDCILNTPKNKLKISKDTLKYYSQVNLMLRTYYELFYKFDKEKLVKIGTIYEAIELDGKDAFEKNNKDALIIYNLSLIRQSVYDMVSPYLSMVL